MILPNRIDLIEKPRDYLNDLSVKYHYMHRPVWRIACPFGWAVTFDGNEFDSNGDPYGFIVFASIHYTRLKNEFGYDGLPTKWQVLSLSRLWLSDELPRNSETVVMGKSHKLVQRRWLQVHPPKFTDQPYHIVKIITYADTRFFSGTIYKAANYREYGRTKSRIIQNGTRGQGMGGAELICYIYDLKEPRWTIENPNGHSNGKKSSI